MTSLLTRDEMHKRVDEVFDAVESDDDEAVAVIGGKAGGSSVHAPNPNTDRDFYKSKVPLGWADFSFAETMAFGNALHSQPESDMVGTLVVPKSDLTSLVQDALDGDEDAIAEITGSGE